MNALLSYHWARIWQMKSLWGILLVVIVCQLLLETQVTPTAADPAFGAWITQFLGPGASSELVAQVCYAGNQMSLGAIYLLLGAAIGGTILCPAIKMNAMLPVTAAGYSPRQQSRCCMVLSLLLCILSILAVLIGEFFLPNSVLAQMAQTQPMLFLGLELYRFLSYLGCAGLGLLLCRLTLHAGIDLPIGALFLTAETLPTLSRICVVLPSGGISSLLFGVSPVLSILHGLLESAVILLLCFLPIGKEIAS